MTERLERMLAELEQQRDAWKARAQRAEADRDEAMRERHGEADPDTINELRRHAFDEHCDDQLCEGEDANYVCLDAGEKGAMIWCRRTGTIATCRDDDEPVTIRLIGGEVVR